MDEKNTNIGDEYINVSELIFDYIRFLTTKWYVLVVLLAIAIGAALISVRMDKTEYYSASAYYSLQRTSNLYTDASITSRVARCVPAITSIREFQQELNEHLDADMPRGYYQFEAEASTDSNLFSVTVFTNNTEYANALIMAFEEIFPAWLNRSIGNTMITLNDEVFSEGENLYTVATRRKFTMALMAACFAWFVIATLRIILIRRVHGEADMSQIVDVNCLGIMPEAVKKQRGNSTKEVLLVDNEHIDQNFLQAVRATATRIETMLSKEKKQTIMITSTLPNEGKSVFTMNLAMILRHRGKSVLVIDTDFHHSGIVRMFKFTEETVGLSDYLKKKVDSNDIFRKENGVFLIPAGTIVTEDCLYVNKKKLNLLLESLKQHMDVILIDTPPTAKYSEALSVSEVVDGVIYMVRGEYGDIKEIKKNIEPYIANGKLCGYVLNYVSHSGSFYGYGNRYSKYHNYKGKYGYYNSRYGYGRDSEDSKHFLDKISADIAKKDI